MLNLRFWLRSPQLIPARLRYYAWERRNPDKPWLCPGTLSFLERHLTPSMVGWEFGSGRSTRWFADRLGHLTSIEHDRSWYLEVSSQLRDTGVTNVDYRFVPLDSADRGPHPSRSDPLPSYVREIAEQPEGSLDLVIVDGHYRGACIRASLAKLKPGGLLLVDDVNLWPSRAAVPVPLAWEEADRSTNGLKVASIWRKPGE